MSQEATAKPVWHAWRTACALAMAAALLPTATAAGAIRAQPLTSMATHTHEVAAADARATQATSAEPLRALPSAGADVDGLSTSSRHLHWWGGRGSPRRSHGSGSGSGSGRRSQRRRAGNWLDRGKPGRLSRGKPGRLRRRFPPTPEGEAQCTVSAVVEEVEFYDADFLHASAIAELFETVCSEPDDLSLDHLVEVFIERDAAAFAQATAAAVVDCQSTDEDAMLCASVTATAHAAAQTLVTAHVAATATAIRGCGCQDDITAFGSSETFIALVAEATATATASACIYGTGRVVSTAYSTCTSYVFARVFARAAAQAIIEGNCLNGHSVAQLLLEADAIDVTAGSTCDGIAAVHVTPGESVFDGPYDYSYHY